MVYPEAKNSNLRLEERGFLFPLQILILKDGDFGEGLGVRVASESYRAGHIKPQSQQEDP